MQRSESYILQVQGLNMETARQFVPTTLQKAFEADSSEAKPMSSPSEEVATPKEDMDKFDEITYSKGNVKHKIVDVVKNNMISCLLLLSFQVLV